MRVARPWRGQDTGAGCDSKTADGRRCDRRRHGIDGQELREANFDQRTAPRLDGRSETRLPEGGNSRFLAGERTDTGRTSRGCEQVGEGTRTGLPINGAAAKHPLCVVPADLTGSVCAHLTSFSVGAFSVAAPADARPK